MKLQQVTFGGYEQFRGFCNDNMRNRAVRVSVKGRHTQGFALLQSVFFNAHNDDYNLDKISFNAEVDDITYSAATETTTFHVLFTFCFTGSEGVDIALDAKEASVKMTALLVVPEIGDLES
jgi:hypothetical protein